MRAKKFAGASAAGIASVALVLGGTGVAGALPGAGSLGSLTGSADGDQCGTTVVTQNDLQTDGNGATLPAGTWYTPGDENAAVISAATDDAHGTGVLEFTQDAELGTSLYQASDLTLAELAAEGTIQYEFTASNDNAASSNTPALQIRVLGAATGSEDGFATIVWSPPAAEGEWVTAKAEATDDSFWVTRDILDGNGDVVLERGATATLDQIAESNPDATILGVGVQQTKGNDSTDVKVDNFTIGCQVTDFEVTAPGPFGSLAGLFGSVGSSEQ